MVAPYVERAGEISEIFYTGESDDDDSGCRCIQTRCQRSHRETPYCQHRNICE